VQCSHLRVGGVFAHGPQPLDISPADSSLNPPQHLHDGTQSTRYLYICRHVHTHAATWHLASRLLAAPLCNATPAVSCLPRDIAAKGINSTSTPCPRGSRNPDTTSPTATPTQPAQHAYDHQSIGEEEAEGRGGPPITDLRESKQQRQGKRNGDLITDLAPRTRPVALFDLNHQMH
jgi:hypothetical protein